MTKLFVQSVKNPEKKFEVLSFDPATKKGELRGLYGAVFVEDLSKANLTKNGYVLKKE